MTDRICLFFLCNLHLRLGNQGSGNRCAEQILSFIYRPCTKHWEYKIPDKFFFQVLYINLTRPCLYGLFLKRRQFLALPQVSGKRNNFASIILNKPFDYNRGVKPAGVGEDNLPDTAHRKTSL